MAADGPLSEALARVEHKLDLVLELLAQIVGPQAKGTWTLTKVGDPNHICPVCTQQVGYQVDMLNKVIARICGCGTGKQAPIDLGAFAPPALPVRQGDSNGNGNDQQEDRSNPNRGGRDRRR